MALEEYQRKRDFRRTPEPRGKKAPRGAGGLFVVQEHAASRHHYDFRLELDGVLKSWAVPKGPSLDPREKRLAVEVEDHPLDYAEFEGTIPEGQYGGGTVLLWDLGKWIPEGDPGRGLGEGDLKFRLEGKKLKGRWVLVRMGGAAGEGGKNWLLMKKPDEKARPLEKGDLLKEKRRSVKSGRTLKEIGARPSHVWQSAPRGKGGAVARPDPAGLQGARRKPLLKKVEPELATLVEEPPEGESWLHEIKFDGYRALAWLVNGKAAFYTRRGQDWTSQFGSLAAALKKINARTAILDGEVVVERPDGTTSFQDLQNALGTGKPLVYYGFDLLYLDGYDLREAPLEERKALLSSLLRSSRDLPRSIRYSDHVVGNGAEFRREACLHALEGAVSKRRDSLYRRGRGRDWLKSKCVQRQEFVIGGYTEPSGARQGIGALLLGVNEPARGLVYAGRVGTGFTEKSLQELYRKLRKIETGSPPFVDPPRGSEARSVHWVKPMLVAEVQYTERTQDGILRHPSFQGLREDKGPEEVVAEGKAGTASPPPAVKPQPRAGLEESIRGVRITHPERLIYPQAGIKKGQVAEYYLLVGERMLGYIRGRPLSLVRCPPGEGKGCFFQRHRGQGFPESLRSIPIREKNGLATYLAADDLAGLLALVQMNVLEVHVWGALGDRPQRPDRLLFDLDPGPEVVWESVVEAALALREKLLELGLESFVKTTGGKGLHLVVPIERRLGWEEVKTFSWAVAAGLAREAPDRYTLSVSKSQRPGKIYLDYLRNAVGATAVAAYSTRARPTAPVSTPLSWKELPSCPGSDHYTVANLPARLASLRSDPWRGFESVRQSITAPMRRKLGLGGARNRATARIR